MNKNGNTVRWLLISTGSYSDNSIDDIPGADNSSRALAQALHDVGIKSENYCNITYKKAAEIIPAFFSSCSKNKEIPIVCYTGHGMMIQNKLYLGMEDSPEQNSALWISFSYLIDQAKNHSIPEMGFVCDCCHSAIVDDSITYGTLQRRFYLNSCPSDEVSYVIKEDGTEYAAITWFLAQAIREGLPNCCDYLSFDELCAIVTKKVRRRMELYPDERCSLPSISSSGNMDKERLVPNSQRQFLHRSSGTSDTELRVLFIKPKIEHPIKKDGDLGIPMGLWLLKSEIDSLNQDIHIDIFDERLIANQGSYVNIEDIADDYDVIGISMCTCEVPPAMNKFRKIKETASKAIVTIAGGIFTYSNERILLDSGCVDYVVPGVATYPLKKLLCFLAGIKRKGIPQWAAFVSNIEKEAAPDEHVFGKSNIDTAICWRAQAMPLISLPVWDQILSHYRDVIGKKIDIYTARGCERNCTFCSVQRETQRSRIECMQTQVITQIEYLYNRGIRYFSIKDEDFWAGGNSRVFAILNHFKSYRDIRFKIRARVEDMMKNDQIAKMAELNVCEIQYGVESPNDDLRKSLSKGWRSSNEELVKFFNKHYEFGITVNASFILGVACEDKTYYKQLIGFLENVQHEDLLKPYVNFLTPHPFKGKIPEAYGAITTTDLNLYTHKNPVCYPSQPAMSMTVRRAMIDTYDKLVSITHSQKYNPPIEETVKTSFIQGKAKGITQSLKL